MELLVTQGSAENVEYLNNGKVHLALMQADAVEDSEVAVIAPLFYEVVHLLVRQDLNLSQIAELRGRRLYLGKEKTGSRATSRRLLAFFGISLEDVEVVEDDAGLAASDEFEAAILVTRAGATEIEELMQGGRFKLMGLPQAWEFALKEPSFHFIYVGSRNPNR